MEKSYIRKTCEDVRNAIKSKSAESLPDNPTAQGYSANEIKKTLYAPITDDENSVFSELDRIVEESNEAIQNHLPKNPSSSSSQIFVATPICKDKKNTDYYGKPLMRITKALSDTLDADLLADGGIADIDGVKYYTKPYYVKRLSENSFTPSENDDNGNPIFSPVSNPYHGIITSENYKQKLEAGEFPKKSNGDFYEIEEMALADHDEPTSHTIPIRMGNGAMIANPARQWPFAVTVNKQLDEVKKELTTAIDNLGYEATNPKHETVNVRVTGGAGWWRIAEKELKYDSVNNIFRVSIMGDNWSEIMFVASQAAGKAPTIAVINHQLIYGGKTDTLANAIIQGIRIQYKKGSSDGEYDKAYLEIRVQYPLADSYFNTSIIKRGVPIVSWAPGDWTLIEPQRVNDTPTMSYLQKSAIDTVWADVTAKTEDINYAANGFFGLESAVKRLNARLDDLVITGGGGTLLYENIVSFGMEWSDTSKKYIGLGPEGLMSMRVISTKPLYLEKSGVGGHFIRVDSDDSAVLAIDTGNGNYLPVVKKYGSSGWYLSGIDRPDGGYFSIDFDRELSITSNIL